MLRSESLLVLILHNLSQIVENYKQYQIWINLKQTDISNLSLYTKLQSQ